MQKTYTVIEIYEADFGCEERPEGQETMVGIRLKAEDGEEIETTDPSEIEEDTYATILSKEGGTSFGEQFADRMKNMSAGDIEVVEGTSKYYVLAKYDILAKEDDFTSRRISLLQTMKGEEYEQKLDNVVNEMGITLNEAALKRYKAKKIKY